jgi:phosphate transport system protein
MGNKVVVTKLEQELIDVKQQALEMGELAESMVSASCDAVIRLDRGRVERVRSAEPRLDQMQIDLDREAIRLMTVYSPAARDLRFLVMLVRITSELERIGDQAMNNSEYVELLASRPVRPPVAELSQMGDIALRMVREALRAFRDDDVNRATTVMALDDAIDAMERQVVRDVLEQRVSDREIATRSVGLLIAHSLERIADHATNICEEVFYVINGQDIRHRT